MMETTSAGTTSAGPDSMTDPEPPNSEGGPPDSDAGSTSDADSTTTGDGGSEGTSASSSSGSDSGGGSSSSGTTGGGAQQICEGDGALSITIGGEDQDHDGRLVWLSAIQPDDFNTPVVQVRLQETITDNAFAFECADGLDENFAYPSWAVVIDADDDGLCSAGDIAFAHQLFGWADDQDFLFEGDALISYETEPPWTVTESAWQAVGGLTGFDGSPFCSYYLP